MKVATSHVTKAAIFVFLKYAIDHKVGRIASGLALEVAQLIAMRVAMEVATDVWEPGELFGAGWMRSIVHLWR